MGTKTRSATLAHMAPPPDTTIITDCHYVCHVTGTSRKSTATAYRMSWEAVVAHKDEGLHLVDTLNLSNPTLHGCLAHAVQSANESVVSVVLGCM